MPKKKFFIRKNGIAFAIVLTVLLVSFSTLLTFYGRSQIKHFNEVKEQTEEANARAESMFTVLNNMDMGVRGFLIMPKEVFLDSYNAAVYNMIYFDTLQLILEQQKYPGMKKFAEARAALNGYHNLLDDIIAFKREGNEVAALEIYERDAGIEVWQTSNNFVMDARAFEQTIYEEAKNRYQSLLNAIALMQALLFIIGVPTLLFVVSRIKKSDQTRQQLFVELDRNRREYLFDDNKELVNRDEKNIVGWLIEDLKKASNFIKNISKGDYSVEWEGINDQNRERNQDNLAGELATMRNQMKQVKEEDQRRLWSTEGLSRVAEITRKDQEDPQKLADHVTSYLVKYVDANQGALYFLEEDNLEEQRHLSMIACYAYDKKKFAEKKIATGQGLVGQTFVEAKTLHLTKIPADYVAITSGLGEATPSSLLIVPLKFNEQTVGIIELASFSFFQPYQIKFLEEVGEIIASSFATVQINTKTKMLLEQSQQQAEEMRAQEEEVRQNMEELQATQEQMQRRTQELESIKENLEQKQEEIEQVRLVQQKRAEEQIKARNKMLAQAMEKAKQREIALQNEIKELHTKINEPL